MTLKQTALYWRTFSAACSSLGIATTEERQAYRYRVLEEEAHVQSTKQLDSTGGFDAVMARMYADAGDYLAAANYATGDDRRWIGMVRDCAIQVLLLSGSAGKPSAYIDGILLQSRLASSRVGSDGDVLLDISPGAILDVFKMLDTHRRRLLRRAGVKHGLTFKMGVRQVISAGVLVDANQPPPLITITFRAA